MSSEFAIEVSGLSKCYEIYEKPSDRLKQMLSRGTKKFYKEFWAIKNINIKIKKGETVGIIGRNGSGKSTLLQLICGTLNPTEGNIKISGRVAALLELGAGFNPEFTGRDNIYMNASLLGLSKEETDNRLSEILLFADIGDFIDQPVKTYSSGMLVRLAFAVMAHVSADILIIDEALAVGDVFFTQKCMRFLREFMENGTVLFVSHDTSAVVNLCSNAYWIHEGVVRISGSSKEVTEKYLENQYFDNQPLAEKNDPKQISLETENAKIDEIKNNIYYDMRRDFINGTNLRNDIEIIAFDDKSYAYGAGQGVIVDAHLENDRKHELAWIVGGEMVSLVYFIKLKCDIPRLLFGFSVKDRLGQILFGDNSNLTFLDRPLLGLSDQVWKFGFTFQMPFLPVGDYSIDLTFGSGTQDDHVIHSWRRDAIVFKSHASISHQGLIGIPMMDIFAEKISNG